MHHWINRPVSIATALAAVSILWSRAMADNFAGVHYDAASDQLVVTMVYRGTNPGHVFSLQWGQCNQRPGETQPEVSVEILDSQWHDVARQSYRKTTRFNLSDMPCRPAKVTLRSAPRFFDTVSIPAKGSTSYSVK